MEETVLCHFLIFCTGLAVVGIGVDADAATGDKDTCYLDVLGFHEADEVLHDDVDTILVEAAMITEAEEVKFETLAFYHTLVGEVVDAYFCEVRLTSNWTQSRKLRAVETYPVVILWMLVFKGL